MTYICTDTNFIDGLLLGAGAAAFGIVVFIGLLSVVTALLPERR